MENFILELSDYNIIKRLNKDEEGQFGNIYLVESNKTKEQFIAKVCKNKIKAGIDQKHFFVEIRSLIGAKHQAILELEGFSLCDFEGKSFPTILTPFIPNGSLRKMLDKEYQFQGDINFTNTKKQICLFGIAIGMKHLHEINIIHRDIKPENILVDNDYYPKICDFGLSKITLIDGSQNQKLSQTQGNIGSPLYMAPEVFDCEYSEKGDIYSYSMILYEIYSYQIPKFNVSNVFQLGFAVKDGKRPDINLIENEEKRKFVEKCWSQEPEDRPSFGIIVENLIQNRELWLPDVDKDELDNYLSDFGISIQNQNQRDELYIKDKILDKEKQYKDEIKYLKQVIDHGNSNAMNSYANMLQNGDGIEKNPQEAIKYYKQAIDLGNSDAMNNYAVMLINGDGIKMNPQEAVPYLKQAINLGNSEAMNSYAYLLSYGEGIEKNLQEAIKYYKQAIDHGNSKAMNYYAIMLKNGDGIEKNPQEAVQYLKQAINLGNSDAMNTYAIMLKNGQGIKKNPQEAIKYYKQAIDLGNSNAMNSYASMLQNGDGIEKNPQEAIKYYKQAIDLGNSNAMNSYAIMLFYGDGIKKNPEEAIKYLKQAMDLGNEVAMMNYSKILKK